MLSLLGSAALGHIQRIVVDIGSDCKVTTEKEDNWDSGDVGDGVGGGGSDNVSEDVRSRRGEGGCVISGVFKVFGSILNGEDLGIVLSWRIVVIIIDVGGGVMAV